jgi:O-antigen ligase
VTLALQSIGALLPRRWRDPIAWMTATDIVAVLLALALPWSTSLVGIFGVVMVLTLLPSIDINILIASLKRPICVAPIALVVLSLIGTLWSDASWGARFHAVGPTARLLILPLLFYHFSRSQRGLWVFAAFLASCGVLAVMSWVVVFFPDLTLKAKDIASRGIVVKNHIDQSQEFALCTVALAYPIVMLGRARRVTPALLLGALCLIFLANMVFVVVSRTALVTIPIMLAAFMVVHLRWQTTLASLCAAAAIGVLGWSVSPQLRATIGSFEEQYQVYRDQGISTSVGMRLEFYQKSLRFFAEAPVLGHGTGSTRGLFDRAAEGAPGHASAETISNPHNQTLNVAIQWGTAGVVVLYTMWLSHLLLFRGEGLFNWIGLLVVVQNIFSSLFNSHIFDFVEGWMYVLGVGVAGGMVLKSRGMLDGYASCESAQEPQAAQFSEKTSSGT